MSDRTRLAAMRKCGVTWRKGSLPVYPRTMSDYQRELVDKAYNAMSDEFIVEMTTSKEERPWSETRQKDRQLMANFLRNDIEQLGATMIPIEHLTNSHCLGFTIRVKGGATCSIEFDGKSSQPDTFVYVWNLERDAYDNGTRFGNIGDVNPFHRHKASRVAYGFQMLIICMCSDIEKFTDGSGYFNVPQTVG